MPALKKIMVVFGTRPEAVKLCPVVWELRKLRRRVKTLVCVTAQHRTMLDQFLVSFRVKPDYDLNLMRRDQTLSELTARVMVSLEKVLRREKPDVLIVQGDTTTTMAASLAAFYQKIPIAHVEAGLRTWNKYSPFPEEINRRMTTAIADVHMAPTERARENLLAEGVEEKKIFVTGNTVVDAVFYMARRVGHRKRCYPELKGIDFKKRIILVTGHRRESFGTEFKNLCYALTRISREWKNVELVYPVHLNPNVNKPAREILGGEGNIHLLDPLAYEPFVYLMLKSCLIISDSGGMQEEAASLGKPLLVSRKVTERPEALDSGFVHLVGTDPEAVYAKVAQLLKQNGDFTRIAKRTDVFGHGDASKIIARVLLRYLGLE